MDLALAVEQGFSDLIAHCYAQRGYKVHDFADYTVTISPFRASYFNSVFHKTSLLNVCDAKRLNIIMSHFRLANVQFRWRIVETLNFAGPLTQQLRRFGFARERVPIMVRRREEELPPTREKKSLDIRRVQSHVQLEDWWQVQKNSFQLRAEHEPMFKAFQQITGFDDSALFQSYVGYHNSIPVCAASLCLFGSLPGLFHVGTLPDARGHGFGDTIVRHTIHEVEKRGALGLGLFSSAAGYGVYKRLGFEPVGELAVFSSPPLEWGGISHDVGLATLP